MKKVGIAGNILTDAVKMIDVWPQKGMLVNIEKTMLAVGGCVCNTAIDLKALGGDVLVNAYGKIGDDTNGEFALNKMRDAGINVDGIRVTNSAPTSFTDVMTVKSTGERTFFHSRGANAEFCLEDIDIDKLDCDLFHFGYLLLLDKFDMPDEKYGTVAAKLLKQVQSKNIKTSIDLVSEQSTRFKDVVIPALKYCNYVIINEIEGSNLTGIGVDEVNGVPSTKALEKICKKIMSFGVKDCVVIHCPSYSCALNNKGEFTVVGSLELPKGYIVGSVGAGDAFSAAMLYSFVNDFNEKQGMQLASCVAACNLAAADSVSGAKTLEETLKLEKLYARKKIEN